MHSESVIVRIDLGGSPQRKSAISVKIVSDDTEGQTHSRTNALLKSALPELEQLAIAVERFMDSESNKLKFKPDGLWS